MGYKLEEIIAIEELKDLFDSFYRATGVLTAVLDLDGKILMSSGWEDICTQFHRVHPVTCQRCLESDVELAAHVNKGDPYTIYRCKNGLIDVAVPIVIDKNHVGNLFTGQFLFEPPDEDFFRNQAKCYGFDESRYMEALRKVKVHSPDKIRDMMAFLTRLAVMIGSLGITRLQQLADNEEMARLLADENRLNEALKSEKAKLETLTTKLESSNKELDDFAYIASHDLREPLRGINNYATFLQEDYCDVLDEEGKNMLASINRLAGRLDEFISSLIYYSRLGRTALEREPLAIQEIIDEVLDAFEFSIRERPTVITILDNQPIIEGNRQNTLEIYRNLIGNALKYNDKPERQIEIGYLYPAEHREQPIFYVKDNGIGIEEKNFDKIFTIFKRLHPRDKFGGGTGAGLTIVKKCIDLLHGRIWIESELGEGTTFFFEITGNGDQI